MEFDYDKLVSLLNQCTYSTCIGGIVGIAVGFIGMYGQVILVTVAIFSATSSFYFSKRKDRREQIEFENRISSSESDDNGDSIFNQE